MVKFLRIFRQGMLTTNKFNKYLLYAIGEVFLVVIGILIALQINNWNEQQKTRAKEIEILKEIRSELSDVVEDLKDDSEDTERNIRSAVIVAHSILNKENFHDSLRLHYALSMDTEMLTASQSGFINLESIGLDIISNDSIRQMISSIYLRIRESIRAYEIGRVTRDPDKLRQLLEPYLMIDHGIKLFREEGRELFFGGNRNLPFKFIDYQQFLKDEEFLLTLVQSIESRAHQVMRNRRFQSYVEEAIERIDRELMNQK